MFDGLKLFDAYGLRAQLFPAVIAGLPTLGLIVALVPWDHIALPHALAAAMSAVLMYAFADLARRTGRKVERKLGTRTTPDLLYRNNMAIEEPLKARYRAFLAKKLGTVPPTEGEERHDPAKANQFYNSAATWLRENTRDTKKFNLLFNELISYGFHRNLLGLKYLSLALNFIVLAVGAAIIYLRPTHFASLNDIDAKLWTVIGVALLHSLFMAFGVTRTAVVEASYTYGRQLVLSCEAFIDDHERAGRR
jgi:hypothetical protein